MLCPELFKLPVTDDWSKTYRERIANAKHEHAAYDEAVRATIESIVRRLIAGKKWVRIHSSVAKTRKRVLSRYLHPPGKPEYKIRISNHDFPNGKFYGQNEYIIEPDTIKKFNVANYIKMIEYDLEQYYKGLK